MKERQLASSLQRRGNLANPNFLKEIYQHLEIDKSGKWQVKPFEAIIRSTRTNSKKERNKPVIINNFDALADLFDISTNALTGKDTGLLFNEFATWHKSGSARKLSGLADESEGEYKKTLCYNLLLEYYTDKGTKPLNNTGKRVIAYGQYLYMKYKRDPALFTLDDFRKAKAAPECLDANGEIKISDLSGIRLVMQFAAMRLVGSPLHESRFQFHKFDEWYTAGKKNIGGKKHLFLDESELIRYVQNIQEIDTLVLHRLTFEGMTRLSSAILMGKNDVDKKGYNCLMLDEPQFACTMYEPKIKKSKTNGKVTRYFTKDTIEFFKKYIKDYGIVGAWFKRTQSSYASSLKAAGFRARIWQFKTAPRGATLAEGEKLDLSAKNPNRLSSEQDHYLVYKLKGVKKSSTGNIKHQQIPLFEGKLTTSHIVGKHTGVSIAGLHGFTLDNCAEQAGTDPSTIRDFYHGTLGLGLQKLVQGKAKVELWHEWHPKNIEPLYAAQYEKLRNDKNAQDAERLKKEEKILSVLGKDD